MPAPIRTAQATTGVAPSTTTTATNTEGASQAFARADHDHRLGMNAQDDGAAIGSQPAFNFTGAGVVVTDDGGNDRVNVAIAGAMGSTPNQEQFAPGVVTGADLLVATLANSPLGNDVNEIAVYLNGVLQNQGGALDYSVGGAGFDEITWLALTGTGIDLVGADQLNIIYRS